MFWKRKPKPAAPVSRDPELDALQAQLTGRQEKAAELEQELFDLQQFTAQVEALLLPLQDRLLSLRAQLQQARGEYPAATPAAAFRSAPRAEAKPPAPPPAPVTAAAEADLKALYRVLAKRFHPDLAAAPAAKAQRQAVMAEVNAAYAARDADALQRLAARPAPETAAAPPSRAAQLAGLRAEIARLDDIIAGLEQLLDELAKSPAVQLKLEASLARRRGENLLGQIAAELEAEIARTEAELAGRQR